MITNGIAGGIIRPGVAIPTEFGGVVYRSRLEANTAQFLDGLRIPFEYEQQSFLLSNGQHYCPDFFLPQQNSFLECRGYEGQDKQFELFASGRHDTDLIVFRYDSVQCYYEEGSEAGTARTMLN